MARHATAPDELFGSIPEKSRANPGLTTVVTPADD